MAIIKMKRLRLVAAKSQREEILRELMLLGCVEISQPEAIPEDHELAGILSKQSAGWFECKKQRDRLVRGIELLDKYAPHKTSMFKPRPMIDSSQLLDESALESTIALAESLDRKDGHIREIEAEISHIRSLLESLKPWKSLDVPLDLHETKTCYVLAGMVSASAKLSEIESQLDGVDCPGAVYEVSADDDMRYVVVVAMKDKRIEAMEVLRGFGFSSAKLSGLSGTAAQNMDILNKRVKALEAEKNSLAERIRAEATNRWDLKLCADRMMTKVVQAENAERMLYTQFTFTFEGWITAPEEAKLEKLLLNYDCAWELSEPKEDEYEAVPVKLKNNRFSRPLNIVTQMYSLPAYGGIDPNPLMAPFFILFYGMMLADIAYGLILLIAGIVVTTKVRPRGMMKNMFELMIPCGISTMIFGAMTGGFLGDFIPQLLKIINPESTFVWFWPPLFTPLNDTVMILIGSMALGFIQIVTGMAISFVYKAKRGKLVDAIFEEATWWVIFAGIGLMVLKAGNIRGIPVVLFLGILMLVIGSSRGAKGFGKITAVIGAVYNGVTGFFGDILSYSRLMALMLAGSVIAQVFNTIGGITNNVIAFVIIALLGNTLNFSLNVLGCFVHNLRLQCLEFFGKFYIDGGREFKPLAINTEYVYVKK